MKQSFLFLYLSGEQKNILSVAFCINFSRNEFSFHFILKELFNISFIKKFFFWSRKCPVDRSSHIRYSRFKEQIYRFSRGPYREARCIFIVKL